MSVVKYLVVFVLTLLFCLTDPGQSLLHWLDDLLDLQAFVSSVTAVFPSYY